MQNLGTIIIDTKQHRFLINEIQVAMTQREFELLIYLSKNKAEIIANSKKGLAIPSEVTLTENNKNFVLLLHNKKMDIHLRK